MEKKHLVLASGSPRRKELLSQLGYEFSVLVTDVEECKHAQETAEEYVKRLSLDKALAALSLLKGNPSEKQHVASGSDTVVASSLDSETVVLGSDTVVVSQGQVLEKPIDLADSKRMLTQLANDRHQVMTAVSVVSEEKQKTEIIITDVWFKPLSEKEIEQYWQTGEPCDKAGSYGIQGLGGRFVTRIEGSYYAVVGLPLFETDQLLQEFL
ncbi:nucleoside triphosphate pyrophosphatase [Vibrio sp. 10N.222.54.F12]|jgi:septum formation protein|uniref:dTTP/UTP pyrophosphatase n=1 Tax=Vibrio tasmaniensis 1F-267 TaxID=1191324 RepID=A0ABX3B6Q2_9VIBR|nr:Maf family protein [Vibrio tasmaniensis]OEF49426.1 septum formation inhibitor Maf [Vibrio tasmaniensis 1F-267]OEF68601.1 septum formation inhibitor Maf [Vibrio tasmaniensis 1F-187]OEF87780.1 septum formation inhibitor Maf [Vibrio tasmaniensis 1F-155]PML12311.1 septum formation inhibitor Maf [Vibrio tasmaniensis]PML52643.1 septum formation inhibitor Maf [Vibrio tasmaniensis]